jgi:hypothetical protein
MSYVRWCQVLTRLVAVCVCRGRRVPVEIPPTPVPTPLALPAPPVPKPLAPPAPDSLPIVLHAPSPPSSPSQLSSKNKSVIWTNLRSWVENEVL